MSLLPKTALCEIVSEEELETFLAEAETGTDTAVMEVVSATAEVYEENAAGREDATTEVEEEIATGREDETGTHTSVMEAVSATAEVEEETETQAECFHEICVTANKGHSKAADRMECLGNTCLGHWAVCNAEGPRRGS